MDGIILLRGSFAFELGPTANVQLSDGSTATVTTLTIGASNVSAFVGWNGEFDPNNLASDTLTGLPGGTPTGLFLQDLNVGIFMGVSTAITNPEVFFAMSFSVNSLQTVGLNFLQADATMSVSINIGASFTSPGAVINFQDSFPAASPGGSAGFEVNTGDPLHPVLLNFTGFLINVQIAGDLTITNGNTTNPTPIVEMQGVFFLNIDGSGFDLFAAADLRVGSDIGGTGTPLVGISALGVVVINSQGFAGDLDVSLQLNVPGISVAVAARVIINTTKMVQGVSLPSQIMNYLTASTSPLAAKLLARLVPTPGSGSTTDNFYSISAYAPDIANPTTGTTTIANLLDGGTTIGYTSQTQYVVAVLTGSVTFAGFATATGTAGIVVSSSGFQLYVNLSFGIGVSGISLNFNAVGVVSISSAGLYLNLVVSLDANLTTLFNVNASGTLLIDTTGPTTRFMLSLNGTLTIASVLSINGSFSINVGAGGPNTWRIAMSLSGSLVRSRCPRAVGFSRTASSTCPLAARFIWASPTSRSPAASAER